MRFKILDKVSINNFKIAKDSNYIKLAKLDNEYYLLESYSSLEEDLISVDKDYYILAKEKQTVIIDVSNEDELLSTYINSFLNDSLNPFKVLLLYKHKCLSKLASRVEYILRKNKDIPDYVLEALSNELEKIEKNKPNKMLTINLTILDAVNSIVKIYNENKDVFERLNIEIKDIINDLINEDSESIEYPTNWVIINYAKEIIEKELKREESLRNINKDKSGSNIVIKDCSNDVINTPNLVCNEEYHSIRITINIVSDKPITNDIKEQLCIKIEELLRENGYNAIVSCN